MPKSARAAAQSPKENRLLAAMPDADYQALLPMLERVPMPLGQAVYESGGPQGFVYFPTSSIVSLLYVLADGATAAIPVTGNHGPVAAGTGQESGVVTYVEVTTAVVDARGVDRQVCGWSAVVRREYARLLPSLAQVEGRNP